MAEIMIPQLPLAISLDGTEQLEIVQSGTSRRTTTLALSALGPQGTVTSVNGSGGTTGLTLTGGPITTTGTLTLGGTLAVANGGTGLTALGSGVATFLGNGLLGIANGGTGQITANAALNALLPNQATHSGEVLSTNGTTTAWMAVAGTGTVTSASVVSANGFAGTVANPTTTPALTLTTTITGILKGNGTAIAAAISGTDIKTVNGTSLLGAGDVTAAGVWGSITGTLSAQTDLQAALDAKIGPITTLAAVSSGAANLFALTAGAQTGMGGASAGGGSFGIVGGASTEDDGGAVSLTGGAGGTTGGRINLTAGASGTAAGGDVIITSGTSAADNAGSIEIFGADSAVSGKSGGNLDVFGGSNTTNGTGGNINVYGGDGSTDGGDFYGYGGNCTGTGIGGNASLYSGNGTTSGYVDIHTGTASAGAAGLLSIRGGGGTTTGGEIEISAGDGASGVGGNIEINAGGSSADAAGNVLIGCDGGFTKQGIIELLNPVTVDQPTPAAVNTTGTLTIANILTRIVTTTSASAVSLTLPTGTNVDAAFNSLVTDLALDWNIINLGSAAGAVTIVANTGHTIVGATDVPIGTAATFRTRKTAGNTFVTYRVDAGATTTSDYTLLDTQATTSGTSVTFSTIAQTYSDLILEFLGTSHNVVAATALLIELSDDGSNWTSPIAFTVAIADTVTAYGSIILPRYRGAAGQWSAAISDLSSNRSAGGGFPDAGSGAWRIAAGIAHIRISIASGGGNAFDAGSIKLYGI